MARTNLVVSSSPQFHHASSTPGIMWTVSACLMPAAAWGVYAFGRTALFAVIASITAAVATEAILAGLQRKFTLWDGSAFLTGLLVGMNMPPSVPAYIPATASFFAIAVVKWSFGGLGTNWMNPALAGRAFAFFSWTGPMTGWVFPQTLQGTSAVAVETPLSFLQAGLVGYTGGVSGPAEFLAANGYPRSLIDGAATSWLNANVFGRLGVIVPQGYVDLFIGSVPGSIGEVSAGLLLLGTIHLFARGIITWEIPASFVASFGFLVWGFGGLPFGAGPWSGDVLFHLFSGGLILGAFYMATDTVSSPFGSLGKVLYGAGAGALSFLIRTFGAFPEGVWMAILIMNTMVPLINKYTGPSRFGVSSMSPAGGET